MAGSYLKLAKRVILAHGKPMSAQHIISEANRFGLVPRHLSGQTMQKTLQARISEDIFIHRDASEFYRTSLGNYFLRSLSKANVIPEQYLTEFKPTKQRIKPVTLNRILFTSIPSNISNSNLIQPSVTQVIIEEMNTYHYINYAPSGLAAVSTFTFLSKRGAFLSYAVGRHSHFRDQVGKRTIGFRRYVDEYDVDLFCNQQFGVETSASREVLYQLVGTEKLDDRIVQRNLKFLGGYYEKESNRFSLILNLSLDKIGKFELSDLGRLEVNDPSFITRGSISLRACFESS